jgi:hypothetical protein
VKRIVYEKTKEFKRKYGVSVAWRLSSNSKIVEKHLGKDEEVIYVFAAQKNNNPIDIFTTAVIALTNKRILIGRKRVIFGYFLDSITPDMFNDIKVLSGVIWGKIKIDTVKELVILSNISKKAPPEIEQNITEYMLKQKEDNN